MELIKQYPVIRYASGTEKADYDQVLAEFSFSLYENGAFREKVCCIPEYMEELILGMLYTGGRISSINDVEEVTVSLPAGEARVSFHETLQRMKPLPELTVCPEDVLRLSDRLLSSSEIFRETGNVHSVMLCRGPRVLYFCEDVDRYHAFEKTVGRALRDRVDFGGTTVYTTGRIPSPIAEKAIRAGIPAIVSRSAPTDLTLELAREYNLTVIGFARSSRMNIYHGMGLS